jgi:hypothetical protein
LFAEVFYSESHTEPDDENVLRYEKTPELRKRCPQFTEYLMGDIDTLT